MQSDVGGFQPSCADAVLRRYSDEARLAIPGERDVLLAYLPADVHVARYGGATGNPLTIVLGERLASSGTLEIHSLQGEQAEGRIDARFDEGEVSGDFLASVQVVP